MNLPLNKHYNFISKLVRSLGTRRRCISTINPIAQQGFGRNEDVAIHYDNSRPNYSIETIHKVSEIINTNNVDFNHKPLQIVEVATGLIILS